MSIEITIVKSPNNLQNAKLYQIFTEQGGTIGRSVDNTWMVEDPEKFISSKHSQIVFEHGQYYLMDLSTNGTFLNGAGEPVGHGNRIPLKDGDRFALGDYEFLVSMRNTGQGGSATNDPFGAGSFAGIGSNAGSSHDGLSPFENAHGDPFASASPAFDSAVAPLLTPGYVENDPLEALDKATNRGSMGMPRMARSDSASQPDNADAMQHAVKWPNVFPDPKSVIPEDWDQDDDLSADIAAPLRMPDAPPPRAIDSELKQKAQALEQRCAVLEAERQKLLGHIKVLTQQQRSTHAPARSSPAGTIDEALIEAMGLSKWDLSTQKKADISQIAGAIVRVTMEGLMQALAFRKKIKEEFRINVTTIQPVENNPLKFSANLEDALENMFVKENKAYQKPLDAVREGFHGISEHQLAVLAGMQAAFRGMIDRLDPASLEQRFEKYRKAGVIKVGQKAKNWESYKEFHKDLVNDIDNSFQHLFGYDFVQAYEEQLQRLLVARKARIKASAKK